MGHGAPSCPGTGHGPGGSATGGRFATPRIAIAEDQTLIRELICGLLEVTPGMEVIGAVADGRSLLTLVKEHTPDIALTDIVLPDLNGIDVTRQICAEHPAVRVIVFSAHTERRVIAEAFRAGASGFLSKSGEKGEVLQAITSVMGGEAYMSPSLAGQFVRDLVFAPTATNPSAWTALSGREREVLQLIAEGRATKDIATELGISVKTVETHRQQILGKLGLRGTADLVRYAIREGLTSLDF
jgi:two-component system, NarL family, response regulator NreC